MDHITIPIPDGLDATQKAELTDWLRKEVQAVFPERMPLEDDPAWRAEATQGIRRALRDVEAGRVMSSAEAIKRLDAKIGFQRPA